MPHKLQPYLANIGVTYIKLHNLHWNVVGHNFKAIHEYLETLYDGFSAVFDETAEIIKIQGGYPAATMKEYLDLATIKEIDSRAYSADDTLKILADDMFILKNQAETLRQTADNSDNYAIVSMLESHLEQLNKTLWFLDAMSQ